jgi:hypothetical protein
MNTLDETKTQVFCSQCDFVTSDFVEFHGEFYCQEQCVAFLPTFESMEDYSDQDWLVSAGWGDDEDYGYYGE